MPVDKIKGALFVNRHLVKEPQEVKKANKERKICNHLSLLLTSRVSQILSIKKIHLLIFLLKESILQMKKIQKVRLG